MNLEYNTQRNPVALRVYGRNFQKFISYIQSQQDKKKRTALTEKFIKMIKPISPSYRGENRGLEQIWNDVHIISNYELDVDAPYPVPQKEILTQKPTKLPYPKSNMASRRYGKNLATLINVAVKKEEDQREAAVIYIGRLIRTLYGNWNQGFIDDLSIIKQIKELSGGVLTIDAEKVAKEGLFERLYRERKKSHSQGHNNFRKETKKYNGGRSALRRKNS